MSLTLEATFDGDVFRPATEVDLKPNTKVKLTIEPEDSDIGKPYSFLHYTKSLNLDAPADFSSRLDYYLYGIEAADDE
jgi:predicted DNA-binding antitoxin AbrB/MazE fold protein